MCRVYRCHAAISVVEDGQSQRKRPSFTSQMMAFCNALNVNAIRRRWPKALPETRCRQSGDGRAHVGSFPSALRNELFFILKKGLSEYF